MLLEHDGHPVCVDTGDHPFDPTLPCLTFIHGAAHDRFVWKRIVNRLTVPGRSILAIDLPGHGRSGGAPLTSIEAMAGWVVSFLGQVGAGRSAALTLIGHSMGSLVALETATRLKNHVGHLVLIGTAIPMPVAPALLDAARNDEPKAMAMINHWAHSPRAHRGACGSLGMWLPNINLRVMERQQPGVLYNDMAACNAYQLGQDAIQALQCPTTLIAGSADRMTSVKVARALAASIPRAHLVELVGVGHALMAEAPEAVAQAIARTQA